MLEGVEDLKKLNYAGSQNDRFMLIGKNKRI
jgi:hypothetical protein